VKARERARAFGEKLRWAVGVRRLTDLSGANASNDAGDGAGRANTVALPQWKNYREADGKFYFKLDDADGNTLLQSRGFDSPKDAGRLVAELVDKGNDAAVVSELIESAQPAGATADMKAIGAALSALKAAKLAKEEKTS
jgi:tryptophanyl-tRNA synthetase